MRVALRIALAASVVACSDAQLDSARGSPAVARPTEGLAPAVAPAPPFDLNSVILQARSAFRPAGDAFEGGFATYSSRARGGELSVRAVAVGSVDTRESSALSLSTSAMHRDSTTHSVRPDETKLADDGSLRIVRDQFTEHFRNSRDGVEQSWHFSNEPPGSGPLVVHIRVTGQAFETATETGVHFKDSKSGLGFRYGHATWIDATGEETPVESIWRRGEIVLSVPEAAVARSRYPAVLDPTITPEFAVDQPIIGPAPWDQNEPRVASDGTNFFVVWADARNFTGANPEADIYGARVTGNGEVIDTSGIAISTAIGQQVDPDVHWNGTHFMVAWRESETKSLWMARVTPAGTVVDPNGIQIYGYPDRSVREPRLSWDGSNYLVVFETDPVGPPDDWLAAVRVTPDLAVLGSDFEIVAPASGSIQDYEMSWNGSNHFVVFGGRFVRVDATGTVLDPIPVSLTSSGGDPFASWDGTAHLVVYESGNQVRGQRVLPTGTVVTPEFVIADEEGRDVSVLWGGGVHLVAWHFNRGSSNFAIRGTRVMPDGSVPDPPRNLSGGKDAVLPQIAFDGTRFLVTFQNTQLTASTDIFGARVTPSLSALDEFLVSSSSNTHANPVVSWNGAHYLVAWEDFRPTTSWDIFGVRVADDGALLDPASFGISTAPNLQINPRISWSGTNHVLVWSDLRQGLDSQLFAARVAPSGSVLDANGIQLTNDPYNKAGAQIAWDGANHLVIWDGLDGTTFEEVSASAFIAPNGAVTTLPSNPERGAEQSLSFDGTRTLRAFVGKDSVDDSGTSPAVLGQWVASTGARETPFVIAASPAFEPASSYNGADHLIVWRDHRNESDALLGDVYGARVSASGTVRDPGGFPIATAPGRQQSPAVTWDGTRWIVAWVDWRTGDPDIFAARIRPDGTVEDPNGFPVASSADPETTPAVGSSGDQRTLIGYIRAGELSGTSAKIAGASAGAAEGGPGGPPRTYGRIIDNADAGSDATVDGALDAAVDGGQDASLDAAGDGSLEAGSDAEGGGGNAGADAGGTADGGGDAGDGGAAGSTGGTSASGGMGGSGGGSVTGGAAGQIEAGAAGAATTRRGSSDDGGCGCRIASPTSSLRGGVLALLVALGARRRRFPRR